MACPCCKTTPSWARGSLRELDSLLCRRRHVAVLPVQLEGATDRLGRAGETAQRVREHRFDLVVTGERHERRPAVELFVRAVEPRAQIVHGTVRARVPVLAEIMCRVAEVLMIVER